MHPTHNMKHSLMAVVRQVRLAALLVALVLALVVSYLAPTPVAAQDNEWAELRTDYFTIVYNPADDQTAQAYAGFIDVIYDDMAAVFGYQTEPPLTLRLYPTEESYHAVNPGAREMAGVVAHADFQHRELAVVLPQTQFQSPEQIQNNIRHELTHIIASELSDNRLNTGFQEGIAQYMELPTPELEQKKALLNEAIAQNRLMQWSDFDSREAVYGSPERSYPQTLSTVTFLAETYGFNRFREFVSNMAQSSGYRSALERTYNLSATELEAQWREWLPSYLDGSYHEGTSATFELSYPRQLMSQGRYTEAQAELEQTIAWLEGTDQPERLEEARTLLAQSQQGQQAEQLAAQARAALEAASYERALDLVEQASTHYAEMGDTRQEQVLAVYAARAERGLQANEQLGKASMLAQGFRLPEAREQADAAAAEFATLGDTTRRDEALSLRQSVDTTQRLTGLTLVTLGLLGVVVSLWSRWNAGKPEVW